MSPSLNRAQRAKLEQYLLIELNQLDQRNKLLSIFLNKADCKTRLTRAIRKNTQKMKAINTILSV